MLSIFKFYFNIFLVTIFNSESNFGDLFWVSERKFKLVVADVNFRHSWDKLYWNFNWLLNVNYLNKHDLFNLNN